MRELFRVPLGLHGPWRVQEIRFDAEHGHLDLWLEFSRGSRFPCPECGQVDCARFTTPTNGRGNT